MRRRLAGMVIASLLASGWGVSSVVAQAADPLAPWHYLQALQALRDKVAKGDEAAWRAQARLVRHMGEIFATLPDETWKKPRNARALLVYLLGGGNPRAARALLRRKAEVALPEGVLSGAIAFVEGRNGLAWKHLQGVDDKALGNVARAQLLLVKASLQASTHPRTAMSLLQQVRLLKPGTLLEEAALRRSLFLAGDEADVDAFVRLAGTYIRRFSRSRYMGDFLRRTAWLLVRLDYGADKRPLKALLPLIERLGKRHQALLLAAVARGAIIAGKRDLALQAGQLALALNIGTAAYKARVRLWMQAARVVSPHPEEPLALLRELPDALLDPRDRKLRRAAIIVGEAIMREPSPEELPLRKAGASDEMQDLPIIGKARAAIAEASQLLRKTSR